MNQRGRDPSLNGVWPPELRLPRRFKMNLRTEVRYSRKKSGWQVNNLQSVDIHEICLLVDNWENIFACHMSLSLSNIEQRHEKKISFPLSVIWLLNCTCNLCIRFWTFANAHLFTADLIFRNYYKSTGVWAVSSSIEAQTYILRNHIKLDLLYCKSKYPVVIVTLCTSVRVHLCIMYIELF